MGSWWYRSGSCNAWPANEHGIARCRRFQVIRQVEEWSYSHRFGSNCNSNASETWCCWEIC
uniref:Uncharacterized protein n=1 Tax=Arundo donax TaxID=35708 RepID=A0A0A9GPT5_ARUDO